MTLLELKQEYNKTLDLINRGSKYLDDSDIPMNEKEKHIPTFLKLLKKASMITREIEQLGIVCTDEELRDGFRIGGG